MIGQIEMRGGALVVRGEAGIGKSALLKAVGEGAHDQGLAVVTTTGTESEARLAFGGLHQLLLPFFDRLDRLPDPQRRALEVAFGVVEGDAPDVFLIGLATLGVVTERETSKPLLLVADDAHWLDRSSAEVLAFVARRLEMEPVIMLFAVRDGMPSALDEADLPQLELGGLDDDASRALLMAHGATLTDELQRQVLAESAGNPLALIELPSAAAELRPSASLPLPLPARLEAAFAARLSSVDPDVRTLLLFAALDDGQTHELSRAAEELLGSSIYLNDWTAASASGLGTLAGGRFRFGHPLMRSAVHQAATDEQRRRAHAALARVLAAHPDRAVWHQAAAAQAPDEDAATALMAAADRARSRGAVDVAFAACDRAATLTADPRLRAMRLLRAGELARDLGRTDEMEPLLREALQLGLPADQAGSASFDLETITSVWSGSSTIPRFAQVAEDLAAAGDDRRAIEAINAVAMRAYWGPLDNETRRHASAIVERLALPVDDPLRLAALALIDPVHRGREVIDQIRQMSPVGIVDPDQLLAIGMGASGVWAENLALPFLRSAVAGYRADGRLAKVGHALTLEAWADVRSGAVRLALTSAAEAASLAGEARHVRYKLVANLAHSIAAAELGEMETAERLIAGAEASLLPTGGHSAAFSGRARARSRGAGRRAAR